MQTISDAGGLWQGILSLANATDENRAFVRRELHRLEMAGVIEITPGQPGRNKKPTIIKVVE